METDNNFDFSSIDINDYLKDINNTDLQDVSNYTNEIEDALNFFNNAFPDNKNNEDIEILSSTDSDKNTNDSLPNLLESEQNINDNNLDDSSPHTTFIKSKINTKGTDMFLNTNINKKKGDKRKREELNDTDNEQQKKLKQEEKDDLQILRLSKRKKDGKWEKNIWQPKKHYGNIHNKKQNQPRHYFKYLSNERKKNNDYYNQNILKPQRGYKERNKIYGNNNQYQQQSDPSSYKYFITGNKRKIEYNDNQESPKRFRNLKETNLVIDKEKEEREKEESNSPSSLTTISISPRSYSPLSSPSPPPSPPTNINTIIDEDIINKHDSFIDTNIPSSSFSQPQSIFPPPPPPQSLLKYLNSDLKKPEYNEYQENPKKIKQEGVGWGRNQEKMEQQQQGSEISDIVKLNSSSASYQLPKSFLLHNDNIQQQSLLSKNLNDRKIENDNSQIQHILKQTTPIKQQQIPVVYNHRVITVPSPSSSSSSLINDKHDNLPYLSSHLIRKNNVDSNTKEGEKNEKIYSLKRNILSNNTVISPQISQCPNTNCNNEILYKNKPQYFKFKRAVRNNNNIPQ